jgi:hypothetical protein
MANEASFQLIPEKGGMNWGYCGEQKQDSETPTVYIVQVETSTLENSETTSTIKLQLYGDRGESKLGILSDVGFERGGSKRVEFKASDVGNLLKILVKSYYNPR